MQQQQPTALSSSPDRKSRGRRQHLDPTITIGRSSDAVAAAVGTGGSLSHDASSATHSTIATPSPLLSFSRLQLLQMMHEHETEQQKQQQPPPPPLLMTTGGSAKSFRSGVSNNSSSCSTPLVNNTTTTTPNTISSMSTSSMKGGGKNPPSARHIAPHPTTTTPTTTTPMMMVPNSPSRHRRHQHHHPSNQQPEVASHHTQKQQQQQLHGDPRSISTRHTLNPETISPNRHNNSSLSPDHHPRLGVVVVRRRGAVGALPPGRRIDTGEDDDADHCRPSPNHGNNCGNNSCSNSNASHPSSATTAVKKTNSITAESRSISVPQYHHPQTTTSSHPSTSTTRTDVLAVPPVVVTTPSCMATAMTTPNRPSSKTNTLKSTNNMFVQMSDMPVTTPKTPASSSGTPKIPSLSSGSNNNNHNYSNPSSPWSLTPSPTSRSKHPTATNAVTSNMTPTPLSRRLSRATSRSSSSSSPSFLCHTNNRTMTGSRRSLYSAASSSLGSSRFLCTSSNRSLQQLSRATSRGSTAMELECLMMRSTCSSSVATAAAAITAAAPNVVVVVEHAAMNRGTTTLSTSSSSGSSSFPLVHRTCRRSGASLTPPGLLRNTTAASVRHVSRLRPENPVSITVAEAATTTPSSDRCLKHTHNVGNLDEDCSMTGRTDDEYDNEEGQPLDRSPQAHSFSTYRPCTENEANRLVLIPGATRPTPLPPPTTASAAADLWFVPPPMSSIRLVRPIPQKKQRTQADGGDGEDAMLYV